MNVSKFMQFVIYFYIPNLSRGTNTSKKSLLLNVKLSGMSNYNFVEAI